MKKSRLILFVSLILFPLLLSAQAIVYPPHLQDNFPYCLNNTIDFPVNQAVTSRDEDDLLIAYRNDEFVQGLWEETDSVEYVYNDENLVIEENYLNYNGVEWTDKRKVTFEYNTAGLITLWLIQIYDNGNIVNESSYVYEYDNNNNQTLFQYNTWENGIWVPDYQYVSTFDSNGNEITELYQIYDGGFINETLTAYGYNANNQVLEEVQSWNGNTWVNETQSLFEYDINNNQTRILLKNWDNALQDWVNENQYLYEYTSNNQTEILVQQVWVNEDWINEILRAFEYDENGNQLTNTLSFWAGTDWFFLQRFVTEYNDLNKITLLLSQQREPNLNDWVNSFRQRNEYDENDNLSVSNFDNFENGDWVLANRLIYYYQLSTNTQSPTILNTKFIISPNPSTGIFNISLDNVVMENAKLSVYNALGQVVYYVKGINNNEIRRLDLSILSDGIYFIEVSDDRQQHFVQSIQIQH